LNLGGTDTASTGFNHLAYHGIGHYHPLVKPAQQVEPTHHR
jgi:hypothetical protein